MKRKDLRKKIIPKTIIDESNNIKNKESGTKDLIYIDSYDEQYDGKKSDMERRISATDYAQMNNAYMYDNFETCTGKQTTLVVLRTAYNSFTACCVDGDGEFFSGTTGFRQIALCPSLHYQISIDTSKQSELQFQNNQEQEVISEEYDIREVKDTKGETIYHTLQIGEYPKTKVDENLSQALELLYHGGKIKEDILCTGRWYSCNGQKEENKDYAGKHSPEFEYKGNRYVRIISHPNDGGNKYTDGTVAGKDGTVRWVKVEPISFKIINWDEMPKNINPKGNEKAEYFDLRAEEAIISNLPFHSNSVSWKDNPIRGFLNGIDIRKISLMDNIEYNSSREGNFTGEENFLNEAFNLSRQPKIEYTIPDSETEIPDDAFNGCITLKKLIIHKGIKAIGKRAFEGLAFKYAYKTETGELIFAQELPKDKEEYKEVVEVSKITEAFEGFDYSILLQRDKLDEIINLSETLNKKKFKIPYVYGLELIKSGKAESFCENSDFRFFKNEIPQINDFLLDFPEEERLDFFKFASNLGCFSLEKIVDKNGRDTQVTVAQKSSSLLAKLLKTEGMRLR
ncbi:MAG: leucine-rich repeat protein [Clostridia bacterium]|nr:leucine-rich repeat protein [Clostridia bacterium]